MAVTLVSRPTTPNVTGTKLLFEVSGSDISHPQYSYVMDIYLSGSSTRIDRQFQQPNPQGVAQFEPSQVLQGQLDYDNLWKTSGSQAPINAAKMFDLRFGEAYGTSISSSITVYPGGTNNYLEVFPGVLDPNTGYNFDTGSFLQLKSFLSDDPGLYTSGSQNLGDNGILITTQDYHTLTLLKNADGDPGDILVVGYQLNREGKTPVTSSFINASGNGEFYTYGVGPKNLAQIDNVWSSSIASGIINYIECDLSGNEVFSMYVINTIRSTQDQLPIPCPAPYLRFAFINKYGFYDYYNIINPLRRETNLQKSFVSLPKVDYSSAVSTYSIEAGAETDYYTDTSDTYTIDTDYIDQDTANWLEQLLESPEVYIQQGTEFVPIVITNSEYEHNNSTARNKLFKYSITFEVSNGRLIQSTEVQTKFVPEEFKYPDGMVLDGLVHFYNAWDNNNTDTTWYDSQAYTGSGAISGSIATGSRYTYSTVGSIPNASYYGGFTGVPTNPGIENYPAPVDFGTVWPIVTNANSSSAYTIQTFAYIEYPPYLWQGIWYVGPNNPQSSPVGGQMICLETSTFYGVPNEVAITYEQLNTTQQTQYFNNLPISNTDWSLFTVLVGSGSNAPNIPNLYTTVNTGSLYNVTGSAQLNNIPSSYRNILGQSRFPETGYPNGHYTWDSDNKFMYHAIYNRTLTQDEIKQNYLSFYSSSYS